MARDPDMVDLTRVLKDANYHMRQQTRTADRLNDHFIDMIRILADMNEHLQELVVALKDYKEDQDGGPQ